MHRLYGESEVAPCGAVRPPVRVWHMRGADAALPLLSRASAAVGAAALGLTPYMPIMLADLYRVWIQKNAWMCQQGGSGGHNKRQQLIQYGVTPLGFKSRRDLKGLRT